MSEAVHMEAAEAAETAYRCLRQPIWRQPRQPIEAWAAGGPANISRISDARSTQGNIVNISPSDTNKPQLNKSYCKLVKN